MKTEIMKKKKWYQIPLIAPRIGQTKVGRILLLGGGIQSYSLIEMMLKGVIPPVDLAIFSDTGLEPWYVYSAIGIARQRLVSAGIPLVLAHSHCYANAGFFETGIGITVECSMPLWVKNSGKERPGRLRRQCTDRLKVFNNNRSTKLWLIQNGIIPLPPGWQFKDGELYENGIAQDYSNWPRLKIPEGQYVEMVYGISLDEQVRATSKRGEKWQEPDYPLVKMGITRNDCIKFLQDNNLFIPNKSACVICPYRNDEAWLSMQKDFPDEFERACKYDDLFRDKKWLESSSQNTYQKIRGELYTHRSCLPLRQVDFEALFANNKKEYSQFEMEMISDTCKNDGGFSCMS